MSSFQPQGRVLIGRVPFDNTYKHVLLFDSKEEQRAYFASKMETALERDSYTYIRIHGSLKVPWNAEELYTYNYVMFQNANYGDKWFYAFIDEVAYVNANCTELILQLDFMQTWMFDWEPTECFVEREHALQDYPGSNINPEPDVTLLTTVTDRWSDGELSDCYVIVQTNAVPVSVEHPTITLTSPTSTRSVEGGDYHNVFSGGKYFAYESFDEAAKLMRALNEAGGADSISALFLFPKFFTPNVGDDDGVATDTDVAVKHRVFQRPTTIAGYEPRNKKLLTYPYTYCQVDDNNGHTAQYRYEYWRNKTTDEGTGCTFTLTMALDPDSTVFLIPQNYNGVENNVSEAFTFPFGVRCSWVYSAYENWLAQNALASAIGSTVVKADQFASEFGADKVFGAVGGAGSLPGKAWDAAMGAIGNVADQGFRSGSTLQEIAGALGAVNQATGVGSSVFGELYRMSKTPDVQKSATSGNGLYACGFLTYNVATVQIRPEFVNIMESFFDMYGYQTDEVKVPNIRGRKRYNYVKTQLCQMRGNVPADDMARINGVFDAGVTFWHDDKIGIYSDNPIIV